MNSAPSSERQLEPITYRDPATAIDAVINSGFGCNASDIHLDLTGRGVEVSYRILGVLRKQCLFPVEAHAPIVARLKVQAGLRTDEHLIAQDGGFMLGDARRSVRVSIIPARLGERVSLRLIDEQWEATTLDDLGVPESMQAALASSVVRSHGLLLIVGATGAGKSTTLRALLRRCVTQGRSVISIEDPIEQVLHGVSQLPATPFFSIPVALRAVLRQDPEVIAVGEIRDSESAALACHAAMTGHLVLATLHAANPGGIHNRLSGLGVSPSMLELSAVDALYQRLEPVRCSASCSGDSCPACRGLGVVGRVAVFSWRTTGPFALAL